jgi:GntR family transcriptional repressor for pyruvate dehydrogenase complex
MKPSDNIKVSPIQKETVPEKIIKQLKELIENGQLKPGRRLPAERALSTMLNVGRPALREALSALSLLGILENRHRKGTFLTESCNQWKIDPLSIMLSVKKGTLMEIFEARESLEMTIVKSASQHHTDDDIKKLTKIVKKMKKAENRPDDYVKLDQQFHEALAEAAKNQIILDLLKKLNRLYFDTRTFLLQHPEKSGMRLSINSMEHEKILQGVIEGNVKKAEAGMRYHLEAVKKALPTYHLKVIPQ